eukprot:1452915-Pyramimonas_sp.AAC.1
MVVTPPPPSTINVSIAPRIWIHDQSMAAGSAESRWGSISGPSCQRAAQCIGRIILRSLH